MGPRLAPGPVLLQDSMAPRLAPSTVLLQDSIGISQRGPVTVGAADLQGMTMLYDILT